MRARAAGALRAPRAAPTRRTFPTQTLRCFASEAGKDVFTETLKPIETKAKEKPKQLYALGRFDRIQSRTKRLNIVCSLVRGSYVHMNDPDILRP